MAGNAIAKVRANNFVKKIISSNIILALGINLIFLVLVLLFCDMKYEVSDDFVMAGILSGAYGNEPNPQIIFVNVLVGYMLLPLYKLFPGISWYFAAQIALLFVSSTAVTYLLFEKLEKSKAVMLSVLFILFFTNDVYILVQFTKTAAFAVMSGSVLFLWALFEKQGVWKILFGGALCLAGTLVRFSAIYIAGGFLLFILIYELIRMFKERDKGKLWYRQFITIVLSGSILIGLAYGFRWINGYTYHNDEVYGHFITYSGARSQVVDSVYYDYSVFAEEMEKIGVSENDYYIMRTWNFADNDVFTLDKLQQTAEIISDYHKNEKLDFEELLENMAGREVAKYPVFLACAVLFILGIFLNYGRWWTMLGSAAIGTGLFAYFCARGRAIYRIEYSIFVGVFLCGVYFWKKRKAGEEDVVDSDRAARCCIVVTALCFLMNVILYIPDQSYKKVTSESRKSYIEDTFYASADYRWQKYRKVVNKDKPANGLLEEFADHKENFYFLDFGTTIQILYYEWSPWEALPVGNYDNYMYLAGVTTNFPDVEERLAEKDLSNPMKSLVKDNVYVVDNSSIEMKLNYLKEHYYPEARVELYKEIDGYQIWKFYEK